MGASRRGCRHSGKPAVVVPAATPLYLQSRVVTVPRSRGRDIGSKKFNNPRLTLVPESSITPSLVASRVMGVAPLYVHFDATATTSTATSYPFHECNFKWNFGDTAAGNYSTTNLSRNIAYGGVAGHVFETAGTFTVTLTVRDPSGTVVTITTQIAVTAADIQWAGTNTICISKAGEFTGKPTDALQIITPSWATAMGYVAAGKRVLFRRGESWTASAGSNFASVRGNIMVGAFGSGPDPTVSTTAEIAIINLNGCDDWRIQNLSFIGPTTIGYSIPINLMPGTSYHHNTNILVSRIETNGFGVGVGGDHNSVSGYYQAQYHDCLFECYIHNTYYWCVYIPIMSSSILGCRIETTSHSHVLRLIHADRSNVSNCIVRWGTQIGVLHVLKFHNDASIPGIPPSKYDVISDCTFDSGPVTQRAVVIGPQDIGSNEAVEDIVFERNYVRATQRCVMMENIKWGTVRNNSFVAQIGAGDDFCGVSVESYAPSAPTADYNWVYNNTAYYGRSEANIFAVVWVLSGDHVDVRNNFGSAPATPFKYPVLVAGGNVTQSNNSISDSPGFVAAGTDFHLAAGSVAIDAGITVASVYDDKDLVARAATYEQGAYEYRP